MPRGRFGFGGGPTQRVSESARRDSGARESTAPSSSARATPPIAFSLIQNGVLRNPKATGARRKTVAICIFVLDSRTTWTFPGTISVRSRVQTHLEHRSRGFSTTLKDRPNSRHSAQPLKETNGIQNDTTRRDATTETRSQVSTTLELRDSTLDAVVITAVLQIAPPSAQTFEKIEKTSFSFSKARSWLVSEERKTSSPFMALLASL